MAFSSSPYIRKRLPQPKARMETLALVRPSVRVGSDKAPGGCASARSGKRDKPTLAVVTPRLSRNFLRDRSRVMATSNSGENNCIAEWLDEETYVWHDSKLRSLRILRNDDLDEVLLDVELRGRPGQELTPMTIVLEDAVFFFSDIDRQGKRECSDDISSAKCQAKTDLMTKLQNERLHRIWFQLGGPDERVMPSSAACSRPAGTILDT